MFTFQVSSYGFLVLVSHWTAIGQFVLDVDDVVNGLARSFDDKTQRSGDRLDAVQHDQSGNVLCKRFNNTIVNKATEFQDMYSI